MTVTAVSSTLASDIRRAVLAHLEAHPSSKAVLASKLHMDDATIDAMALASRWDLGLGLRVADALDLRMHVVTDDSQHH
jgi:hypothetical protein